MRDGLVGQEGLLVFHSIRRAFGMTPRGSRVEFSLSRAQEAKTNAQDTLRFNQAH